LPSSHGHGTRVMKNCDPPVFGPALAIDRIPGLSCLSPLPNSSVWCSRGLPCCSLGTASLDHKIVYYAMKIIPS
jgi:hypothetical protein